MSRALYRARRSACGGWGAGACGWAALANVTHGADQTLAVLVTAMCATIALLYGAWLLIGGRP